MSISRENRDAVPTRDAVPIRAAQRPPPGLRIFRSDGNFPFQVDSKPCFEGGDRLRRGLRTFRGVPRCSEPRKTLLQTTVANDDNYALAA